METPEENPEEIPRIKDSAYWPYAKFIPVLSNEAQSKLENIGALEKGLDIYGDDTLIVKIDGVRHFIPKFLTSKHALLFLGFTKPRADELWEVLLRVSPPVVIPVVGDAEQAFWLNLKLWLADEFYIMPRRTGIERDDEYTKTVLDLLGLSEVARLQRLKIEGDNGPVFTSINEQEPKDILPLVQRYIYHRWNLLAHLNKSILADDLGGKGWWTRLKEEFTKDPVDLDVLYNLNILWRHTDLKNPREIEGQTPYFMCSDFDGNGPNTYL